MPLWYKYNNFPVLQGKELGSFMVFLLFVGQKSQAKL